MPGSPPAPGGQQAELVPDVVLTLERMPRTATGKTDRMALARLPVARAAAEEPSGPDDDVERVLRRIWSEVLGIPAEEISVFDDFFGLGAHSLTVVRAVSLAVERLGVSLSPRDVFDHPVLSDLVVVVRKAAPAVVPECLPRASGRPLTVPPRSRRR